MKAVIVHGVLALVGLLLAYQTWQRTDEETPVEGDITIVDCEPSQLASFSLQDRSKDISVVPKNRGGKRTYWFTVETQTKTNPSANNTQSKDEPKTEASVKTESFLANDSFETFLKGITPFRAVRAFGKGSKDLNKLFESEDENALFELQCDGKKHAFEVGPTTFGMGNRYIRNTQNKKMYLIPGKVVRKLKSAKHTFMQKSLHQFELKDVDRAVITARSKTRELYHKNHLDQKRAIWVDAKAADRRNQLFENWFSQVAKLKSTQYLPEGEEPGSDLEGSGEVESLLNIAYFRKDKELGKLQLVRINAEKEHYYAKTETTGSWVKVLTSNANLVAQDIAAVVGAPDAS